MPCNFQVSDYKRKNFFNLNNNDNLPIRLTYSKGGAWLKLIGLSNSLYTQATRAIKNHAYISEYHLRFFPKESFGCLCSEYPIESRNHILHDCRRYMKYWNPNRKFLKNIIAFLKVNSCQAQFIPGVKVCNMDSEMCGLVEQPWLQLICYTIYLSHGYNFRW